MTTDRPIPVAVQEDADRIVAAHAAARDALIDLSNVLYRVATEIGDDFAIDVAYRLAHGGSADAEGLPTALLGDGHGDRLLELAADVRAQIHELVLAGYDVPTYVESTS